jgi:hypothetical protein
MELSSIETANARHEELAGGCDRKVTARGERDSVSLSREALKTIAMDPEGVAVSAGANQESRTASKLPQATEWTLPSRPRRGVSSVLDEGA